MSSISRAVEIGLHHDGIVICDCSLQRLSRIAAALETRRSKNLRCVPPNTLTGFASCQRPLIDVLQTPEPTACMEKSGRGIVRAAAGQKYLAAWKAFDARGIKSESLMCSPAWRARDRHEQQRNNEQ